MAQGITVDFSANIARFTSALDKATNDLNKFQSNASRVSGNISKAFGALGVGLSVAGIMAFVKGAIDAADQINDLSKKVGISIEALAGWKLAAEQSGTSLESIAKGVKGLSGYAVDHADKLKKLGITATDSSGMMIQLADVFAKLPDGITKSKLAVDVFGKAGMDMIPMLNLGSQGLADAQEKAAEYGRRMKELAPDADKFNDQLAELSLQASAAGISLASLVTGPMTQWLEANNQGIRITGSFTEALRLFVFNLDAMTSEKPVEELKRLTKALEEYQAASSLGKFMQSPTGFLFGGRESDLQKQIQMLEFLKKQEERASQMPKPARTPEQAAADILKQREFDAKVRAIIGGGTVKKQKQKPFDPEGDFWFAVDEAAMKNQKKRNEDYWAGLVQAEEDANRAMKADALEAQKIISDVDPIYKATLAWNELTRLVDKGFLTSEQAVQSYAKTFGETTDQMSEYAKQAGRNIQDAFAEFLFDPFKGGLNGMLDGFQIMLRKMAAEAIASNVLKSLGNWGSTGGGAGSFLGNIAAEVFAPKALGGPVSGGTSYLVGERGPEIFTPSSSGNITPNDKMGRGITVVNNFTLNQPADRRTQEQIAAMAGASIQNAMMRGA